MLCMFTLIQHSCVISREQYLNITLYQVILCNVLFHQQRDSDDGHTAFDFVNLNPAEYELDIVSTCPIMKMIQIQNKILIH